MDLRELGGYLKSRRDRISPADVGLSAGPRRRVAGLRRDEVATLARASVDYYVQLEQGRGTQPSEQMLAALARALRLTSDERDHLYHLAGRPLPPASSGNAHVQPALLSLLEQLTATPAQVMTDLSVPLVQNRLAEALLGAAAPGDGVQASFVYQWFTDPAARERYHPDEHEHQSRVFVADLRAAIAKRGRDALADELLTTLLARSEEFAHLWDQREVAVRRADRKRLVHPALGVLELDCMNLLSEDGGQRLLWFTAPPGSDHLELLAAVGTQDLAPR
ncbi:helix-turn-helix protein [Amycolatopsis echigonensis]|uniref:Helix-turn-helix protein n=1 Tax=Amycolatopsis echigonensis TaxID=2576905 RepID=A0A2N3WR50_9PSEU|nr:helix-turn-helix domain-containing protein [Amycolatopsis niigatensis]PKV96330.1 helix-turn-helix protein [Amycolatopsis niigatensis]